MTVSSLVRPIAVVGAITTLLLCIPLVAMQFTAEVNWSVGDFLAAVTLIFLSGTAIVVGVRLATTPRSKALVVAVVLFLLLLVWAELAVGIFT